MNWDHNEYTVAGHYLSALINDDSSGLTDEECDQVREFAAEVTKECGGLGHWSVETECGNFCRCEISGLMADCYDLAYVYQVKKNRGGRPRSGHARICGQCGEKMVECFRKSGKRYFKCKPCAARRQIKMLYRKETTEELYARVERRLISVSSLLEIVTEIIKEREENGSD